MTVLLELSWDPLAKTFRPTRPLHFYLLGSWAALPRSSSPPASSLAPTARAAAFLAQVQQRRGDVARGPARVKQQLEAGSRHLTAVILQGEEAIKAAQGVDSSDSGGGEGTGDGLWSAMAAALRVLKRFLHGTLAAAL